MEYESHEQMLISELTRTLKYCDEFRIEAPGIDRLRSILDSGINDTDKFNQLIEWMNQTNQGSDVF